MSARTFKTEKEKRKAKLKKENIRIFESLAHGFCLIMFLVQRKFLECTWFFCLAECVDSPRSQGGKGLRTKHLRDVAPKRMQEV